MISARDLVSAIHYELHPYPTTYGACQRCASRPARGGGICLHCRTEELADLVGRELALEYVEAFRAERRLRQAVYDEADRKVRNR